MEQSMSPVPEQHSNDEYFVMAYDELRRRAGQLRGQHGAQTLNPTALVNEAYVRITQSGTFSAQSKRHLKYVVIRAMKNILVENARAKAAARRGGGSVPVQRVDLENCASELATSDPRITIAIALALDELERSCALEAQVFECQFFGGLEVAEIAELFAVSGKKVQRTLRLARAKLRVALERAFV
jgi:RNA polymerase sigma factor (TIGR02999 family)